MGGTVAPAGGSLSGLGWTLKGGSLPLGESSHIRIPLANYS